MICVLLATPSLLRAEDSWSHLGAPEREVLAPFESEWPSLEPRMRARLRMLGKRWSHMPEAQRVGEMERFRRWRSLPPAERQQLRRSQRAFQQLDSEQRARVRGEYQRWQNLDPAERAALRASMGARPPAFRGAMRQLEEVEQLRLRAAVAGLRPQSRRALRQHLMGLGESDALRVLRAVIAEPDASRDDLIARLAPTPAPRERPRR